MTPLRKNVIVPLLWTLQLWPDWQQDGKNTSFLRFALNQYFTSMEFHRLLGKGKAQTDSGLCGMIPPPIESLENFIDFIFQNSYPRIFDGYLNEPPLFPLKIRRDGDIHFSAVRGILINRSIK